MLIHIPGGRETGTGAKHSYAGARDLPPYTVTAFKYANAKRARDKGEETKFDVKQ